MFTEKRIHLLNIIFGLIVVPMSLLMISGAIIFTGFTRIHDLFLPILSILAWAISYYFQLSFVAIKLRISVTLVVINAGIALAWMVYAITM